MVEINGTTSNGTTNGHSVPSGLPDSKSETLALVHPTKEEKIKQFKSNGVFWRGALSMEAYLRREEFLANQEWTRDGGITYWALIDTAAKERLVLCGCETFRKKALLSRNGKVEDVLSHGIGSVFCPPELRRRGYAARMMRELGEKLKTWQANEKGSLFSVLFSDIGKEFYNAHGWEPFNSSHISVSALSPQNAELNSLPEARPLYPEDLEELCKTDERLIRESMKQSSSHSDKTFVAVVPDIATIRWHHAREEFVAQELYGKAPQVKGAIVGAEPGKRVWCYWTRMWYNDDPSSCEKNTLHVLRLVVEEKGLFNWEKHTPEEAAEMAAYVPAITALLRLAQREAQQWHMAEVEVWNPTDATVKAAQAIEPSARTVARDKESIASLRWYGERLRDGPVAEYVDWIGNEKYGWC